MPRVLIIDDQADVRAAIAIGLRIKGFEVVGVESGPDGLKEFDSSKFELVIVDIFLKGMNGTDVIRLLRERTPNLPIVAISGVTSLDFLTAYPDLPNVVCLQKPFRPNELMRAIQEAMGPDQGPMTIGDLGQAGRTAPGDGCGFEPE
jgi:DNA-binding response OmpR family regulator